MSAAARWLPTYIGIGSNLDDPALQVARAFDACRGLRRSRLIACSRRYGSPPLGPVAQGDFVNAVAGVLTQLSPEELLAELRQLEQAMGRVAPRERWGPRRIDFDLLVHGGETRATGELRLPHPEIAWRDFVLYPLNDVAPDLEVPGVGRVAELLGKVENRGIKPLDAARRG